MIATYAAALAVGAASLALGQAAISLCGARGWSWLSPAVGLALLCAVCWATVRLPGAGVTSAVTALLLTLVALVFLRGRVGRAGETLRVGAPVGALALLVASLPFAVEGHFGILGTSFNPDMSQHLLAADRLAHGQGSQLLHQGYPLGPHAVAVALNKGLGIGLVQGFSGLMVAIAVLTPLTALAAFSKLDGARRTAAALLVGLPYLVASYFAQGAFKETMQALFVLAFALALRESIRAWRDLPLRFVPAALLAAGSAYAYSFPGLAWLAGTAAIWAAFETFVARRRFSAGGAAVGAPGGGEGAEHPSTSGVAAAARPAAQRPILREVLAGRRGSTAGAAGTAAARGRAAWRPAFWALIVFGVLVAPEVGRMLDFRQFETFDPSGPGLGNLFGQVSPLEALGVWPSGDFRVAPGDGAVPASLFWLGSAFALALLVHGVLVGLRRREIAIPAALASAALAYLAARVGGTPYTAAKALEVAAPLASLAILLPLLGEGLGRRAPLRRGGRPRVPPRRAAAALYATAAAGCSLLALANAPVGPTSFSPALAELRPLVRTGATLVLAPPDLLADQHGAPFLAWELRGGRVCVESATEAGAAPPPGVRFVIALGSTRRSPYAGLRLRRVAPPYVLWERAGPVSGPSPCPLIAVRQARQGPAR